MCNSWAFCIYQTLLKDLADNQINQINILIKLILRSFCLVIALSCNNYWEKLTFSRLRFSKFKKLVSRSVSGELQIAQISFKFKTSCCNLKIRGLGAEMCVAFLLFYFWKELWCFKVKKSILSVEWKYKL